MKSILTSILITVLLLFGCNASKKSTDKEDESKVRAQKIKIIEGYKSKSDRVNYQIKSASINNDVLSISVQYSGGCEEHSFDLIWNKFYMKSLPAQATLHLNHVNNDDICRKLIMDTLHFNLTTLQLEKSQELIIKLESYKEKLNYKY